MRIKRDYANPQARRRYQEIMVNTETFPFSFTYNGREYSGFGSDDMDPLSSITKSDGNRETTTARWLLDKTLTVTLICSFYESHGATEWTVWFENTSEADSKILEKPQSRIRFEGENPVLRGIYGDHVRNYEPYCFDLSKDEVHFRSDSGRATHENFPYFNLEYGDGGAMLAIGWAGTWTADFERADTGVTYTAKSVNNLRTYLKPGEKLRTALFVVAPYTVRNEHYATNYWRNWYTECNMPKADALGNDIRPFSTACIANDTGLPNSDGSISENHTTWKPTLEKMLAEDVRVDFRWVDAGWYIAPDLGSAEAYVKDRDWYPTVGTWELDPAKWPDKTFLESTDFARKHGMKTLMWFEPERVTSPDELMKNFGYKKEWAIVREGVAAISNNIGDEECLKWTTDRICKTLTENKVEMYREDNNCNPAPLWEFLDSREGENRTGITECKFITGHYKMWDDIIACTLSYGGCGFVDSCASGGGRNDLESMRRGVPLLRSDADRTTTALRLSMTTAFNKWIPFCGANTKEKLTELAPTGDSDRYIWRASYLAALNVDSQFAQDPGQDFEVLRSGLREWEKVSPYLLKEFYVLTPWNHREDTSSFTAFSYFDPGQAKGVLLAFRQQKCEEYVLKIDLPYLEKGMACILTDEDTGERYTLTYDELRKDGLCLTFDAPRTARLLWVELTGA